MKSLIWWQEENYTHKKKVAAGKSSKLTSRSPSIMEQNTKTTNGNKMTDSINKELTGNRASNEKRTTGDISRK